ncbi:Protein of unknown function [Bacillus thuringiensis]|uniref:Uncharacterized protein n=1 Tax=Bacillus thuringiensis TaxID=1428 RepID=A0A1C4G4J6_BACTU|nr:Protein of unknown function [Bacillus thuringiensis]SCN39514.1 Protein of unknown function [Bacillus wiedmannii]
MKERQSWQSDIAID